MVGGNELAPDGVPSILAGRQHECAILWEQFQLVQRRHGRVALVTGEPGIGKTRLLNELATRTAGVGATVLRGGASEAEGMPPYLPFLEALGSYVQAAPRERLRTQVAPVATTLVTILPELTSYLGDLPIGYPLPPEQARLRLYESVGTLLAAISTTTPVVLVLDDLQWADPASLDLLVYIASHHATDRVLMLGAYRDDDSAGTAVLEKAVTELHRRRLLTTVSLAPLSVTEVAELAAGQLRALVGPEVSLHLHAQSEGNPFFAEEVLRGWVETNTLICAEGHWTLTKQLKDTLPPGIISMIRQRLMRLPTDVVDDLRAASVIGRTFDVPLLAVVTGRDAERIEESLFHASAARLIRPEGSNSFSFSHDKTRECLYAEVSTTRRQRLHEAIGHALEARSEEENARRLASLAFHFARSGDRRRGLLYSCRAAEEALRTYAPSEAVTHFQVALSLLGPKETERGKLLLGLGEAALLAGDEDAALAAYDEAQISYEQAADAVGSARAAHAMTLIRGNLRALPAARAEVDAAMRLVEYNQAPRHALLGRMYAWRAIQYALQGEWRDVGRLIAAAWPIVQRVAGPQQLAFLRQLRGLVAYQRGAYSEASSELQAALALCKASDSGIAGWRPGLLGLLGLCALAHVGNGQPLVARACLIELDGIIAHVPASQWPTGAALTSAALGWVSLGDYEQATVHYSALLPLQGELHWFLVNRVLGLIDISRGDWDAATAHLSMAEATARQEDLRPELGHTLMGMAELELARGKRGSATRADDVLHQALTLFHDLNMVGAERHAHDLLPAVRQLGPQFPGGLTTREVAVLRLVALGQSNREIAHNLALSQKTVANHLTSIFNKLTVDNRAAAATFAVRHGLA